MFFDFNWRGFLSKFESKINTMKRNWNHFFSAQFLGVFNDNVLKNLICFVAVLWIAEDQKAKVIALASALMVLPFILLSPLAGKLASSHAKAIIFKWAKACEIPIAILACTGFLIESLPTTLLAMLCMGVQSAIYSPAKYGLIKELSAKGELGKRLGIMEFLSFTAVLIGALAAGVIADLEQHKNFILSSLMLLVAVIGYLNSRQINSSIPAGISDRGTINPIRFFVQQRKATKSFKGVNNAILGMGLFWFIASMLQMNLLMHCPSVLGLSNSQTGFVSALVAVGIGTGCYLSGRFNKKRVALGMLFPSMLGLGSAVILLALSAEVYVFIACLMITAFFGGLFKIPLNTWIQEKTDEQELAKVLAFSNMVVFVSILLSAGAFAVLDHFLNSRALFLGIGGFSLLAALGVFFLQPIAFLRGVVLSITKALYRFKITGEENIPLDKGAIVVCNHVSMLDSLVILKTVQRNIRFVMHDAVYQYKALNPLFKKCNMIPISSGKSIGALEDFTQRVKKEVEAGHLVCIFPEGKLARTGQIMSFKKGIEHLIRKTGAPVLPLHIQNMQGTPLSYKLGLDKRYTFHPKNWRKRITVEIGNLITFTQDQDISAFKIRQNIKELEVKNIAKTLTKKDKEYAVNQVVQTITKGSYREKVSTSDPLSLVIQSPNYRIKDLLQRDYVYVGTKENTNGKPIPGVHVKVLNEQMKPCEPNETGMLYMLNAYAKQVRWMALNIQGYMDECGFVSYCI